MPSDRTAQAWDVPTLMLAAPDRFDTVTGTDEAVALLLPSWP